MKNNPKAQNHSRYFNLLEVLVSFSVLMLILETGLCLYNTAIQANSACMKNLEMVQNSQTALDMIARDLECLYYGNGGTAFWHWKPVLKPASWESYRNELLAFVAQTPLSASNICSSQINKIKYQKYYSTNHTDSLDGWLRRSATGNLTSGGYVDRNWNYAGNFYVGFSYGGGVKPVFTANSKVCNDYQKVIPYVIDISFKCYDKDGNEIVPSDFVENSSVRNLLSLKPSFNRLPCTVDITLILLDSTSWRRWIALGGNSDPEKDSGKALEYRLKNQRKFKRIVFVGVNKQQI